MDRASSIECRRLEVARAVGQFPQPQSCPGDRMTLWTCFINTCRCRTDGRYLSQNMEIPSAGLYLYSTVSQLADSNHGLLIGPCSWSEVVSESSRQTDQALATRRISLTERISTIPPTCWPWLIILAWSHSPSSAYRPADLTPSLAPGRSRLNDSRLSGSWRPRHRIA